MTIPLPLPTNDGIMGIHQALQTFTLEFVDQDSKALAAVQLDCPRSESTTTGYLRSLSWTEQQLSLAGSRDSQHHRINAYGRNTGSAQTAMNNHVNQTFSQYLLLPAQLPCTQTSETI